MSRRALHLYRRGAAWWWRRRLPAAWSARLGPLFFRFSLRTQIADTAVTRARQMDAAFEALLAELQGMQAQGQTIDLGMVRSLVKATLDQLLDQDEIARACAGRRAEADVHAALARHQDAARSVQQALRYNDLSSVAPLVETALHRHGITMEPGAPLRSVIGREMLLGMQEVHAENARREEGIYVMPAVTPGATRTPGPAGWHPPLAFTVPGTPGVQAAPAVDLAPAIPMPAAAGSARPEEVDATSSPAPAPALNPAAPALQPSDGPPTGTPSSVREPQPRSPDTPSEQQTLDELAGFFAVKRQNVVSKDTLRNPQVAAKLFAGCHGQLQFSAITNEHCEDFREWLRRVPRGYGQETAYRGLTIVQAIERADDADRKARLQLERDVKKGVIAKRDLEDLLEGQLVARMVPKTVNKHLSALQSMLAWLIKNKHLRGSNPFEKTQYQKSMFPQKPSEERDAFTRREIYKIFTSPAWTGCASEHRRSQTGNLIIKDGLYWVPLLCLYGGMRREEAAQLRTDDVGFKEGVPYIIIRESIGADGNKIQRTKNPQSPRRIPLHRDLLQLGFMRYYDRMRRAGKGWLFPDITTTLHNGRGGNIGHRFETYLSSLKLKQDGRLLHSFRHNFTTSLLNRGVPSDLVDVLLGHKADGETASRYFKGHPLLGLQRTVDLLNYRLQFVQDAAGEWQIASFNQEMADALPADTAVEYVELEASFSSIWNPGSGLKLGSDESVVPPTAQ